MKLRISLLFITSLFFALMLSQVRAQDSHVAQSTLQRPTLVSTGLPPVNQQTPRTVSPTPSPSPTRTPTRTHTPTYTATPTATATDTNTATATASPTITPSPTYTASASHTPTGTYTAVPSNTPSRTATASPTATFTRTLVSTLTSTSTEEPSSMPTLTATATDTETSTPTLTLTSTVTPSHTPSPTLTETPVPINVVSSPQDSDDESDNPISPLFLGGIGVLAILSLYVISYALNASAIDRYATGFPLHTCPVCGEGHLDIEERPYRVLGIPRVRRTVRCDNCRSILREVGRRRWRYSVDPNANPDMFQQHNNTVMSEPALMNFAQDATDSYIRYLDEE